MRRSKRSTCGPRRLRVDDPKRAVRARLESLGLGMLRRTDFESSRRETPGQVDISAPSSAASTSAPDIRRSLAAEDTRRGS